MTTLHHILDTELGDDLPPNYNVAYYEGQNHSKRWLISDLDLKVMNGKFTLVVMFICGVMCHRLIITVKNRHLVMILIIVIGHLQRRNLQKGVKTRSKLMKNSKG